MDQLTSAAVKRVESRFARRGAVHFRNRGASLGLTASRVGDLVCQIGRGLPFKTLESLAGLSALPIPFLASLVGIPERTLARRKVAGKLSADESERLLRISGVFEKAVGLFEGDVPAAVTWLTLPKRALGHQTPLDFSRSELGAREVENLIGRLEYGVFS